MYATKIDKPEAGVRLSKIATIPPKSLERADAEAKFAERGQELFDLQQLMYGAGVNSLLVVLQGRDAAGKDGTVKHVAGFLNPRGLGVYSFGIPSKEEAGHDFLWRVHPHAPEAGHISIFNRSHYEDVLVVRVHDLIPPKRWKKRYAFINNFEAMLADAGTLVVKIFLHVSAKEEEERLLEREIEDEKAFKINPNDWRERQYWRQYTRAYENAFKQCASKDAPWYVVPADKKWFRNLCVAEILHETLKPHRKRWQHVLEAMGTERRAELAAYRAETQG
ncbi:MAG: deoxynucleoside kinase [Deltaproteobacteria bacterium]|nr:deoxynucleoside kinase [Deltaproteobacteria bacterium]